MVLKKNEFFEAEDKALIYGAKNEKERDPVVTKHLATGDRTAKQVRLDVEGDPVMTSTPAQPIRMAPSISHRRSILAPQNINSGKN